MYMQRSVQNQTLHVHTVSINYILLQISSSIQKSDGLPVAHGFAPSWQLSIIFKSNYAIQVLSIMTATRMGVFQRWICHRFCCIQCSIASMYCCHGTRCTWRGELIEFQRIHYYWLPAATCVCGVTEFFDEHDAPDTAAKPELRVFQTHGQHCRRAGCDDGADSL